MNIQYCSDLHLEFPENRELLKRQPLIPTGEILLLAGDIMPFTEIKKFNDFINLLSDQFAAVYWVPGNHEYYYSDIADKPVALYEKIRSNFFLVSNQLVQYRHVNLVFSTLWSHISPRNEWEIQQSLTDFHIIKNKGRKFLPAHFSALHSECRSFLETAVSKNAGKNTIVVTHHVPTLINYPPIFKTSPLNEAFAVEMSDFIEGSGISYWIYGHHHTNTPAFNIGATQLLTNQLGYVSYNEHKLFRRDATFTLL